MTTTTRRKVLERDFWTCFRCGQQIRRDNYSLQHRRARGMGGSRAADTNGPQNLLTLCGSATTGCHGEVEQHRTAAIGLGYTLHQGEDPATVAVYRYDGRWLFLNPDFTTAPAW